MPTRWSSALRSDRRVEDALPQVRAAHVEAEAERRRRLLGIEEARMRAYVLGRPMPHDLRYLDIQIELASDALCRLFPIPADYASDVWWPNPGRH